MKSVTDVLQNIEIGYYPYLLLACVVLIIKYTSYARAFFVSPIESILVNKDEETKKHSLSYIILFVLFCVINYFVASEKLFVGIFFVGLIIVLLFYFVFLFLLKVKICQWFSKHKEEAVFIMCVLLFPVITYTSSELIQKNMEICATIASLVEIFIVGVSYLHPTSGKSQYYIELCNEKWYVFRRIDNCFMCGNNKDANESTRIRMIEMNYITQNNIEFKKEVEQCIDKG